MSRQALLDSIVGHLGTEIDARSPFADPSTSDRRRRADMLDRPLNERS
jgi:hypothetical protein